MPSETAKIKELLVVGAAISTIATTLTLFVSRITSQKDPREEPIEVLLFYADSGRCAKDVCVRGGFGERVPDENGSVSLPGKYLGSWIDIIDVPTGHPIIGMILERAGEEPFVKIPLPGVNYEQ